MGPGVYQPALANSFTFDAVLFSRPLNTKTIYKHSESIINIIDMLFRSIEDILRDTDSEIEEADKKSQKSTRKEKKAVKKTWLQEGESEIMDFMDASANKKILGTKLLFVKPDIIVQNKIHKDKWE